MKIQEFLEHHGIEGPSVAIKIGEKLAETQESHASAFEAAGPECDDARGDHA